MNMKVVVGLLGLLSAIAICTVLHLVSGMFVPLVIAWFLLQVLRPVNRIGMKLKFSPALNITLAFTTLAIFGVIGVKFCTSQVVEFVNVYSAYSEKLSEMFNTFMTVMSIPPETLESFDWMAILRNNARSISEFIVNMSSSIVLTLVFLMFMLLEAPYLEEKVKKAFSGGSATRVKNILDSISQQISSYLGALTFISLGTGVVVWLILTLMDAKLAAGWGVLSALLNFIPTVGSIIATIPPVVMAFIQFSPSFFRPLIVLISLATLQLAIGNVLMPKVMGDRLGVSPIMLLLSLLLWGMIWGIPGALLSTPIISIIKIVCENIDSLRPIAILIGSGEAARRAPLPPVKVRKSPRRHHNVQEGRQEQA